MSNSYNEPNLLTKTSFHLAMKTFDFGGKKVFDKLIENISNQYINNEINHLEKYVENLIESNVGNRSSYDLRVLVTNSVYDNILNDPSKRNQYINNTIEALTNRKRELAPYDLTNKYREANFTDEISKEISNKLISFSENKDINNLSIFSDTMLEKNFTKDVSQHFIKELVDKDDILAIRKVLNDVKLNPFPQIIPFIDTIKDVNRLFDWEDEFRVFRQQALFSFVDNMNNLNYNKYNIIENIYKDLDTLIEDLRVYDGKNDIKGYDYNYHSKHRFNYQEVAYILSAFGVSNKEIFDIIEKYRLCSNFNSTLKETKNKLIFEELNKNNEMDIYFNKNNKDLIEFPIVLKNTNERTTIFIDYKNFDNSLVKKFLELMNPNKDIKDLNTSYDGTYRSFDDSILTSMEVWCGLDKNIAKKLRDNDFAFEYEHFTKNRDKFEKYIELDDSIDIEDHWSQRKNSEEVINRIIEDTKRFENSNNTLEINGLS